MLGIGFVLRTGEKQRRVGATLGEPIQEEI